MPYILLTFSSLDLLTIEGIFDELSTLPTLPTLSLPFANIHITKSWIELAKPLRV